MRAVTAKIVSKNGVQSTTTHNRENAKAAPATVAVTTAEGSRSAAPVTMPGPMRCRPLQNPGEGSSRGKACHRSTFPRSFAVPSRGWGLSNLGKVTLEVSFNLAFVPQAQRAGISNDAEGGDGGHKEGAAHAQKKCRRPRGRDARDYFRITRGQQQRESQRQHAQPGQQAGNVFGPFSLGVVLGEEMEAVKNQHANGQKIGNDGGAISYVHIDVGRTRVAAGWFHLRRERNGPRITLCFPSFGWRV